MFYLKPPLLTPPFSFPNFPFPLRVLTVNTFHTAQHASEHAQ